MMTGIKKSFAWILAALLFAALCFAGTAEAEKTGEEGLQEWTMMFYLCGSDLESRHGYATANLADIPGTGH